MSAVSWLWFGFDSLATVLSLHVAGLAVMLYGATADTSDYDRYWMVPGF